MRASIPAACLLAVLTLVGCDDTPQGGTLEPTGAGETTTSARTDSPSEPDTTEPSEPETPPVPTIPAEAAEDSKQGAEAFVRYYIQLLSHGYSYGEVEDLRAVTLDSCEMCLEYADAYAETAQKGGQIVDGDATWQIGDLIVVNHEPGKGARVGVNVTIGKHTLTESADATPIERPESRFIFTFILSRQEESWAVELMTQA